MKWLNITTSSKQEIYELWENNKKILTLFYNPLLNTARIDCFHERRVFLMGKKRFRKSRTIIRNEYGIKMGQVEDDRSEMGKGMIELDGKHYHYLLHQKPETEFIIYKDSTEEPLAVCKFISAKNFSDMNFIKESNSSKSLYPSLLMAVCWYKSMYTSNNFYQAFA
ncbi:MAG TPA: hypothetical protein VIQ00_02930 [Chitinophagaceae bacterium]